MTDKAQLEVIAQLLVGHCFMPPDHDIDAGDMELEIARSVAQQILDLCQPDIRACERITVIALKYCPKDHHDWEELKRLSYKIIPSTVPGESE